MTIKAYLLAITFILCTYFMFNSIEKTPIEDTGMETTLGLLTIPKNFK